MSVYQETPPAQQTQELCDDCGNPPSPGGHLAYAKPIEDEDEIVAVCFACLMTGDYSYDGCFACVAGHGSETAR